VVDTAVGYAGGSRPHPTYEMVCAHDTGHAEVVLVEFDPSVVAYEDLVREFFRMHEPSRWNSGGQYRSAVFTFGQEQVEVAQRVKDELIEGGARVATEITDAPTFWRAEEYHQRYLESSGRACRLP
jgi:peptide-methionine (S)-S-oxide reductase